jgi:mono/diheme cytochrome c family protein
VRAEPIATLATAAALLLGGAAGCQDETQAAEAGPTRALETPEIAKRRQDGERLFFGRAGCTACHKVGARGTMIVGPNLGADETIAEPLGVRAATRRPGLSPLEYAIESMVDPNAYVVATYAKSVMKPPDEPPVQLTDDEILAVALFVVTGGAPSTFTQAELDAAKARIAGFRETRKARAASSAPATSASADELAGE